MELGKILDISLSVHAGRRKKSTEHAIPRTSFALSTLVISHMRAHFANRMARK